MSLRRFMPDDLTSPPHSQHIHQPRPLYSIPHDLKWPKTRFHFPAERKARPLAVHAQAARAALAQILRVAPSSNRDQAASGPLNLASTPSQYVKLLLSCVRSVASTIPSPSGNWYQEIWFAICKST